MADMPPATATVFIEQYRPARSCERALQDGQSEILRNAIGYPAWVANAKLISGGWPLSHNGKSV